jgi:membrane protein
LPSSGWERGIKPTIWLIIEFSKGSIDMATETSFFKNIFDLLKETFNQWKDRDPFNNSTVIAFYTIFSLPGLLVIVITVAGYFYDKKQVTTHISTQIQNVVGGDTASDIESMISKASETKGSVLASILGVATLLFGATGVFYQLQQMLNKIWEVKPKVKTKQKILELIKDRLFSFGLILAVGFLLLVSLVISAAIGAVNDWVSSNFSESLTIVFSVLDILVSLAVVTFLFAAIFKFLPDVKITWRDVWPGAFLTSILFVIAKFALGLYLGQSDPGSTYGAAGSIILIMLWVSYAGLILFFGAEFTRVYVNRKSEHKPAPRSTAVSTSS